MKEKIKAHFLKFNPRHFVVFTVLTLFVTDLVNTWFLRIFWQSKNMSLNILRTIFAQKGVNLNDFSAPSIEEMVGFVANSFSFFLFIILVNNLFFYLFYLRRKLWAQGFILFYALTGALLQLTYIFDSETVGRGWIVYNLLTIPYYLYIFLGVKFLKAETTDAVPEKKAQ